MKIVVIIHSMNEIMATPPISFFFLLLIFLVSFLPLFLSFVYSVFGTYCMFCGNKSSSQKKFSFLIALCRNAEKWTFLLRKNLNIGLL